MPDSTTPTVPATFDLQQDAWGHLVLIDAEGKRHERVAPVRGFPLSDPGKWVSICDASGRELLCISDLAQLAPHVRQVLEDDLSRREFMPVITRIVKASGDTEPCEWDVETDRGPTRFVINSEDDVRRIGPQSGMVVDSHGIRYLIANVDSLDAASRRVVQAYL